MSTVAKVVRRNQRGHIVVGLLLSLMFVVGGLMSIVETRRHGKITLPHHHAKLR